MKNKDLHTLYIDHVKYIFEILQFFISILQLLVFNF